MLVTLLAFFNVNTVWTGSQSNLNFDNIGRTFQFSQFHVSETIAP